MQLIDEGPQSPSAADDQETKLRTTDATKLRTDKKPVADRKRRRQESSTASVLNRADTPITILRTVQTVRTSSAYHSNGISFV